MDGTDKLLVFVHCGSLGEASSIGRELVDRGLAACATVGTHTLSIYRWRGERHESTEYPLLLKTSRARFEELAATVKRLHSYEVPEIVAVAVQAGSAAYLEWMDEQLKAPVVEAP